MTANKTTRAALVTGGGSGMGEATSLRIARDGLAVGVLDINQAAAAAAAQIQQAGGGHSPCRRMCQIRRRWRRLLPVCVRNWVRFRFWSTMRLLRNSARSVR